ncbi:unnamed protein product, partial [marine sediment metagenome]
RQKNSDYDSSCEGAGHTFPGLAGADFRGKFMFAKKASDCVSSYVSGLYDKNEH